jgi:hypothetical protein
MEYQIGQLFTSVTKLPRKYIYIYDIQPEKIHYLYLCLYKNTYKKTNGTSSVSIKKDIINGFEGFDYMIKRSYSIVQFTQEIMHPYIQFLFSI